MTDDQLEARLRDWYRAEIPSDETAPTPLRSRLTAIPRRSAAPSRRFASRRGVALLAAALLTAAIVGSALLVGSGIVKLPSVPPSIVPSTAPAGVWTTAGRMMSGHWLHTATLLPDGRVLIAGGSSDLDWAAAELYDPATRSWTATGAMTEGRLEHTATLLRDGRVLVAGGSGDGDERKATAELYDPETGTWTATGNMTQARVGFTATLLRDGRVLVAGGADRAVAELYDPSTGTWTAAGNMVGDRHEADTLLPDGTVLVAGHGDAELYDPSTGLWTYLGPMVHDRWDSRATLLPDGTVLVEGGGEVGHTAEIYDPRSRTWTATGSMIDWRLMHTATLLPDGTVLVSGGHTENVSTPPSEHDSAELYDPRTRTWSATASMDAARRNHTATLLPDGRVLIVGGIGAEGVEFTAELYDPGIVRASPTPTATTSQDAAVVASPTPQPATPSTAPTALPASSGLIAYVKFVPLEAVGGVCARAATTGSEPAGCSRIWVSSTDGTGAHELLPDHPGYQTPIQWSADGTRLLIEDAAGLWLVDTTGTIVQSLPLEGLCPGDCTPIWSYSLSPDGATIAFARPPITTSGNSVIVLADVATGHVTELASTASLASTDSFGRDTPRWSPDGTRLIFTREEGGSQPGGGLFLVDADGTDLHQFVPIELQALFPRWSPDGSLIAFESYDAERQGDIYVVRPDGTGLLQVTSGGYTVWPEWTADGRLVSTHLYAELELWIMDADGANTAMLPVDDVTRLTAAKCLVCAWDPEGNTEFRENALWQPQP